MRPKATLPWLAYVPNRQFPWNFKRLRRVLEPTVKYFEMIEQAETHFQTCHLAFAATTCSSSSCLFNPQSSLASSAPRRCPSTSTRDPFHRNGLSSPAVKCMLSTNSSKLLCFDDDSAGCHWCITLHSPANTRCCKPPRASVYMTKM